MEVYFCYIHKGRPVPELRVLACEDEAELARLLDLMQDEQAPARIEAFLGERLVAVRIVAAPGLHADDAAWGRGSSSLPL